MDAALMLAWSTSSSTMMMTGRGEVMVAVRVQGDFGDVDIRLQIATIPVPVADSRVAAGLADGLDVDEVNGRTRSGVPRSCLSMRILTNGAG